MQTLSVRTQVILGLVLVTLFAATRGYHTPAGLQSLPSLSWAAFFLAGAYLRPAWPLAALFGLAVLLDYAAIVWGGVSSYCVSPAYVALVPAYTVLWLAGRWYAGRPALTTESYLHLALSAATGALVCELISSGSFYFFSGRFADPTFVEFTTRLLKYFPHDLGSMAFWTFIAAGLHAAIAAGRVDNRGRHAAGEK